MKAYLGTIMNPVDHSGFEYIRNGVLLVDDDGVIAAKGPRDDVPLPENTKVYDFSDRLILPGFVDVHCHIAQIRAVNVRYAELLAWLNNVVFPLEAGYGRKQALAEAPGFFSHLMAGGTTCAGMYVTVSEEATDAVFEVADRIGYRAVIGKVMMDRHSPDSLIEDTGESLDKSERLCAKWHGKRNGRLRYAFTPRFALTCSMELMKKTADLARKYNAHAMTHVSENRGEIARAAELFPDARSYLGVYEEAGLLFRGAVYGHCIYFSERDWEVMAGSGAGVAHCPTSNLLLESGILDLSQPFARNIPVGLGSDIGAGSEPMLPEVAESSISCQIARKVLGHEHAVVSPQSAFYMMTKGGAACMGLEDSIGDLEPGKQADFIVVDPRPSLPLQQWDPDGDDPTAILYSLLLRFRIRAVREVYIAGRKVHSAEKNS